MNVKKIFLLGTICVATSACAGNVYKSRNISSGNANTNGLTYALPTTWFEVTSTENDNGGVEIEIATIRLADAGHVYSLDHVASGFARDELTIEVGANQLLQKIDTTTEDVTDEILVELAEAASTLATFSLPQFGAPESGNRGTEDLFSCSTPPSPPWRIIIDPLNSETWPSWLNQSCLTLASTTSNSASSTDNTREDETCRRGICHRAPVPYRVTLDLGDAGSHQFIAPILNNAPILSINVNRALFVEKQVNLGFSDGVLTTMSIVSPSPVLEAAMLPVDVARAIFSAPTELLQLRVNLNNQAAADRQADERLLEAVRSLEEARNEEQNGDE